MMIRVYSSNGCKNCTIVKMFLEANKIEHVVKNISTDEVANAEFEMLNVMGVPAIVTDDEVLVGWSDGVRDKLATYIK